MFHRVRFRVRRVSIRLIFFLRRFFFIGALDPWLSRVSSNRIVVHEMERMYFIEMIFDSDFIVDTLRDIYIVISIIFNSIYELIFPN